LILPDLVSQQKMEDLERSAIEDYCSADLARSLSEHHELGARNSTLFGDEEDGGFILLDEERCVDGAEDDDTLSIDTPDGSASALPALPAAHLTVPRLHIAILVCGTRGDVQPFVIIGQLLKVNLFTFRLRLL